VQHFWARELLGKLGLRGNEDNLDLGCGDGKVTAELAALVPNGSVHDVDNSPQMIELARATFPAASHLNLSFQLLDVRH